MAYPAGRLELGAGDRIVAQTTLAGLADTVEESTTFGRVRPDQKRTMVGALQSRGHTVAMTGDGEAQGIVQGSRGRIIHADLKE